MNKKSIIILILGAVLIGIIILLDMPAFEKNSSLKKEISFQQGLLNEKEELLAKVEQLKKVYEDKKEEIERAEYVLPTGKKIPDLIVQLEALASESGLILEELSFKEHKEIEQQISQEGAEPIKTKPYKRLDVFLSVVGSYESFRAFSEALEYNIRLLDIQKIKFSAEEIEEGVGFVFDVELSAYYQE